MSSSLIITTTKGRNMRYGIPSYSRNVKCIDMNE